VRGLRHPPELRCAVKNSIAIGLLLTALSSGAQAQTMAKDSASQTEVEPLTPEGAVAEAAFYVGISNVTAGVLLLVPGAIMTGLSTDTREICDATACAEVREVKDQELHSTGVAFLAAGGVVAFTGLVTMVMGILLSDDVDDAEVGWVPQPRAGGLAWSF